MTHIVDRRFDSKNKSSVNRSRFLRRFREEIRRAVSDTVNDTKIRDLDDGRKIGIPGRDLAEPQFSLGSGGIRERVHPGNDSFNTGDEVDRPNGGRQGAGRQGSPDGEGYDAFSFHLSREEFLEVFFEELALPNLLKRHLATTKEFRWARAGYSQTGVPANINFVRTMRGAAGRRIALTRPSQARVRELQDTLERLLLGRGEDDPEVRAVREEMARLRFRVDAVPFIDTFDLRYNNRVKVVQPSTQAVMFCLMDVSGSMDESKKNIAKRFFTLLYLFLNRNYERIDVVFIRHHTTAEEVDEDSFFHSRETGGTIVSSALALMRTVIEERYASGNWNIYGAQASDGDNWDNDSTKCQTLLQDGVLPLTQHFAYIEIATGSFQNLWKEYEKVQEANPGTFAMQRIAQAPDIYPVFRELFKKRL